MSSDQNMEGQQPKKINLDTILMEEVGQFGMYQLKTFALTVFPIIFAAWAAVEYNFTTVRIPTRCLIPECDGPNPEFAPSWKEYAIPKLQSGAFDQCLRFVSNSSGAAEGTCPASLFSSITESCEEHVYQNTDSIVYDFKLGCDEWRRSLIGSIRTMGSVIVQPMTGYISDRWGRRVALTFTAFNTAWLGLVRSFVNTYGWFMTLEVLESVFGAGAYATCFILVTELAGPNYRVAAGALVAMTASIGQVLIAFIAWGVPQWKTLTQVLYAPQLLMIFYYFIITESVRWLMSKGQYEEAEEILRKVAKTNKRELSEMSLKALRASAEAEKKIVKEKEPWLIFLVFRSRTILSRCIVMPILWLTKILVYYGMGVNSVNLSGNMYLNYAAVAAMDIPGCLLVLLLLNRIGRKPVIIGAFFICAICQFVFAFLPDGLSGLSLAFYLVGRACIASVVLSVYTYTLEVFPTKHRHKLFALSSMVGRIGAIIAPLTPSLASEIWEPFPPVLFGSLAVLSGLLVLFMPETLGTKLPDTIEEAEKLSK